MNTDILRLRTIHIYVKSKLGFSCQKDVSIYDLATRALELDGFYKPPTQNSKKWVKSKTDFIKSKVAKKQQQSYKPKNTGRSFVVGKVTFEIEKKEITPRNYTFLEKMPSKAKITKAKNVASTNFLNTYEWRKLRMEALIKYGRKCACCGATPESGAIMNVDHIKPRKTHPELALDINNLQILCSECNHGKGNWDSTDWR